jgi:hypothetical protein
MRKGVVVAHFKRHFLTEEPKKIAKKFDPVVPSVRIGKAECDITPLRLAVVLFLHTPNPAVHSE